MIQKPPNFANLRRQYGHLTLEEQDMPQAPLPLLQQWLDEACASETEDPTAMVLSTVDEQHHPDSRVVLLKGLDDKGLIFYTHYQSCKGRQLAHCDFAAANFYWPVLARQIRIRGRVSKLASHVSDAYFKSRPKASQISAIASEQSKPLASRTVLEKRIAQLTQTSEHTRPTNWGGYQLSISEIEFWQGRDDRAHDRIHYTQQQRIWHHQRLFP